MFTTDSNLVSYVIYISKYLDIYIGIYLGIIIISPTFEISMKAKYELSSFRITYY